MPPALAVLGGVSLLSVLGAVPLEVLAPEGASPSGASDAVTIVAWCVFGLSLTAVGVVVARREPRNPMGWLLLVTSIAFQLGSDAPGYAYLDYHAHHGALPLGPVAVLLSGGWVCGFLAVPLIIVLFPDGRPGAGWRWPLRAYLAVIAVFIVATQALATTDLRLRAPVDGSGNLIGLNHPGGWFGPFFYAGFLSCFVLCVASVSSQVLRYRRASGERREQVKWLGAAAGICVGFLLTTTLWSHAPGIVGDLLFPLGLTALPVGIGVGIMRYRLYEIAPGSQTSHNGSETDGSSRSSDQYTRSPKSPLRSPTTGAPPARRSSESPTANSRAWAIRSLGDMDGRRPSAGRAGSAPT